jgi:hypothetical protein
MDKFVRSYIDLLLQWIPLHRSALLYAFYNDILFRRYQYYTETPKAVIEYVDKEYCDGLDKSTVEKSSPGELLLVYHIDLFRKKGGFDVVMQTISEAKPIGIKYFKDMIRFLWMIKPFYDDQIKTEILPRVPEAAFRSQLLNFDKKSLREVETRDMKIIFNQMRLILTDTCDVESVLLEHGFEFALKCLEADILTKRMLGVEWVTSQLLVEYSDKPEMKEQLREKLVEKQFFQLLFNHSVLKKNLIDSSSTLLTWLLTEKAVSVDHLDCIMQSIKDNHFSDEDLCDAFFDLLSGLVFPAKEEENYIVPLIWERLVQLPPKMWSARSVNLVGRIARGFNPPSGVVERLWEVVDGGASSSSPMSPEGRSEAIVQLGQVPGAIDDKQAVIRDQFVAQGRVIHLRLLVGQLDSLSSDPKAKAEAAAALFEVVFPPSLPNFAVFRQALAKTTSRDKIVDVYGPLDEIRMRLDLLATLIRVGKVVISREQLTDLWNAAMNEGERSIAYTLGQEERDVCLESLYKLAVDAHPQFAGSESSPLEWLLALVATKPEFASQTRVGFAVFREIFEGVNGSKGLMEFLPSNRGNQPVLKSLEVIGMDAVWGVALSAAEEISKDTADYLQQLYLSPAAALVEEAETLRQQLCAEAMARMKALVEARKGTLKRSAEGAMLDGKSAALLTIIKGAVELTTRAEDLAKKRDGISSSAAPEVALKDPPMPKYSDQKQYVKQALDSGMLPDYIPEELRYVVVALLFDRFNWMRFESWAGDMYDDQDLVLRMIDKSREYKRILPEGTEKKVESSKDLPSCGTILASSDPVYWETFFALLKCSSAPVSQMGWEVMSLLDQDELLYAKITLDDPVAAANIDWDETLGELPDYKLLHSLQLLERCFIPDRDDPAEEQTRKTQWCKKFLRAGGFRYLIGLLHSLASQSDIHGISASTQCLVRILDVVYRFLRAPLPSAEFAPELESRSPLELSVSSEKLMFSGPTILDIPEVMFSLVHGHAVSEHNLAAIAEGEQQQTGAVGKYAIYLLISCVLKVPSIWANFRDGLSTKLVVETLCSKNASFANLVGERLLHLCRLFNGGGEGNSGPTPHQYFLKMLLQQYPLLKADGYRHNCSALFSLLGGLLEDSKVEVKDKQPLMEQVLQKAPKDDPADPDEYLAGIMMIMSVAVKKSVAAGKPEGGAEEAEPPKPSQNEEILFTALLEDFLYAPLTPDGAPTALAKSHHLRKACFHLIGTLASSGSLGMDGLDRGLNALGLQYMDSDVVCEWKELAPGVEDDDADRAVKTSRYMGLRNMACTCYMNATVQQLFNVTPFVDGILHAPTPEEDLVAKESERRHRLDQIKGLSALGDVLRKVLADPADELNRFLSTESLEFKDLEQATHKEKSGKEFLLSLGWLDDGSGSMVLQSTDGIDSWQGLLRELNEIVSRCRNEEMDAKEQVNPIEMFAEFQRMMAHLSKGGARYFDPKLFVSNFPDFDGRPVDVRRQEDAFEFFNRLQWLLEDQLKGSPQAKIFEDLFGVREVQVVHCDLHAKSSHPQVAPVIPVGFAPNIMQALDQVYNKEGEYIAGLFKCEQCAKSVRGRKTMALESTSDYLVIYIKRYDVNLQKIKSNFEIDLHLDLGKWSYSSIHSGDDHEEAKRAAAAFKSEDWKYDLVGTLNHDGVSMNAGHYFSVIQKEDGSWWKFNDTTVTPFRKSVTEGNIGGDCVMLFYKRQTPVGKYPFELDAASRTLNQSLESDVVAENIRLHRLKLLNEKSLFDTMLRLLSARATCLEEVSSDRRLWLGQLGVRFVFETLARFRYIGDSQSPILANWSKNVLQPLFQDSLAGGRWLLQSLLTDRLPWLEEFLLRKDEANVRRTFVDLVWTAIQTVFQHEVETEKFPVPQPRVTALHDGKVAVPIKEDLPLSMQFMDRICSMTEFSRPYWRNHQEFWDLIARWAEMGALPRRHLAVTRFALYKPQKAGDPPVALELPYLVLDYFLGQYSKAMPKSVARRPIGDKKSMSLTRQFDAFALVMRSLSNPSKKRSPLSLDVRDEDGMSVLDGLPPYAACDEVCDLLNGQLVTQFLTELIKLGYNYGANCDVMVHWTWDSEELTRVFIKHSLAAVQSVISSSRSEMIRYPVAVLVEAVKMEDSLKEQRVARIFEGTVQSSSLFELLKKECHVYSKENAEKVISVLAPFAKVMTHKGMSNNVLACVRDYVSKEEAGKEKEELMMKDAILILDKFGK